MPDRSEIFDNISSSRFLVSIDHLALFSASLRSMVVNGMNILATAKMLPSGDIGWELRGNFYSLFGTSQNLRRIATITKLLPYVNDFFLKQGLLLLIRS